MYAAVASIPLLMRRSSPACTHDCFAYLGSETLGPPWWGLQGVSVMLTALNLRQHRHSNFSCERLSYGCAFKAICGLGGGGG